MKKEKVHYGAVDCFEKESTNEESDKLLQRATEIATKTRLNSYSPYSNFKVGAAVVSASSNEIYGGCNVENGSYGATICAERNAILKMIAQEGPTGIKMVVVISDDNPPAPPCALCLQVLAEFCNSNTELHLYNTEFLEDAKKGIHQVFKFNELLPHPFVLKK